MDAGIIGNITWRKTRWNHRRGRMRFVGTRADGVADGTNVNIILIVRVIENITDVAVPSDDVGIITLNICRLSLLFCKRSRWTATWPSIPHVRKLLACTTVVDIKFSVGVDLDRLQGGAVDASPTLMYASKRR